MAPYDLASSFASAARQLLAEPGEEQTLETAVAVTVDLIEACHHAGISIVTGKGFETAAATSDLVRRGDELQYQLIEGPCIDSLRQEQTVSSPDLARDPRWPSWGPTVVRELGVRSMLCFQLFTDKDSMGALNLYSRDVGSFDSDAQAVGVALAAQIAVALKATRDIASRDQGIITRTVIGQAQGILMERFNITDDNAFRVLKRISQDNNMKLVGVADYLVQNRCLPFS